MCSLPSLIYILKGLPTNLSSKLNLFLYKGNYISLAEMENLCNELKTMMKINTMRAKQHHCILARCFLAQSGNRACWNFVRRDGRVS